MQQTATCKELLVNPEPVRQAHQHREAEARGSRRAVLGTTDRLIGSRSGDTCPLIGGLVHRRDKSQVSLRARHIVSGVELGHAE
jgi:hypothetical protein